MKSPGEDATVALCTAAQRLLVALNGGAPEAEANALELEYQQRWQAVRDLAEAADQRQAAAAAAADGSSAKKQRVADDADELAALQAERERLRHAIGARNGDVKRQIDMLRDLLCAAETMNM